jgi:pimeloyl-ACP methyl ester carboxylesterase
MALSSFADGRLWGVRHGHGPARVLALHGWQRAHDDFAPVLDGLDALAVDLPGFGLAPEPPQAWDSAGYAAFVAPVLDDMAVGPVVVLGHSFGARVAAHLAASHPGRVAALVLTGAPFAPFPGQGPARPATAFRLARSLHHLGVLPEHRMEAVRRRYGSEDYRQATPMMRAVLVKAVGETAGAAYGPVLAPWTANGGRLALVWGEADTVASLEGTKAALAAAGASVSELVVVPGARHVLGAGLHAALREALARALAGAGPAGLHEGGRPGGTAARPAARQ